MSKRLMIMRPKLFIAVAVISLVVAYPVSRALADRDTIIQSQQREDHSLQLQIDKLKRKAVTNKVASPKPTTDNKSAVTTGQTVVSGQSSTVTAPLHYVSPPTVTLASFACANYKNLFQQYNWNAGTAMAICQAESSGNPNAVSNAKINVDGISDFGLMQLHGIDILDPASNISYAYYHKYLTQGWGAWSTYNSGAYSKFL